MTTKLTWIEPRVVLTPLSATLPRAVWESRLTAVMLKWNCNLSRPLLGRDSRSFLNELEAKRKDLVTRDDEHEAIISDVVGIVKGSTSSFGTELIEFIGKATIHFSVAITTMEDTHIGAL